MPLYQRLVDPFTSLEALWEFENIFVRSGETGGAWAEVSTTFETLKVAEASEANAQAALDQAKAFVEEVETRFSAPAK